LKRGSPEEQEKLPYREKGRLPRREISFRKICPWGGVKL
jgi:hypothetical protein